MAVAYFDRTILNGGRAINPQYDGYAEYVFNSCCRVAINTLSGDTAEDKFAMLILVSSILLARVPKYISTDLLFSIWVCCRAFLRFERMQ